MEVTPSDGDDVAVLRQLMMNDDQVRLSVQLIHPWSAVTFPAADHRRMSYMISAIDVTCQNPNCHRRLCIETKGGIAVK